jgi:hypothetical protein
MMVGQSQITNFIETQESKEREIRIVEKETSTDSTQDDENNTDGKIFVSSLSHIHRSEAKSK